MNEDHRYLISIFLTVCVIGLSIYVVHRFIPSLLWGAIITMVSFPLYERWHRMCSGYTTFAALTFTILVAILICLPLSWLISVFVQEIQIFINFIVHVHQDGETAPEALTTLPWVGKEIGAYWQQHFSLPGGIKSWLTGLHLSLTPASYYLKQIGVSVVHRSVQLGFSLLCVFFFYRDGRLLIHQVDKVGEACLGKRWSHFAHQLPTMLRATVNGTILVGLGVGLLMGLVYGLLNFPAPALAGVFTAIAAMIPFAVPFVFIIVAVVLWAQGSILNAFIILALGTAVMFIADHFLKPVLIGNTTKLHFLAVLFGILGGVEGFGVIGLFLGPMVMVLFMTLWRELLD
jgi:predicted PurR-regulated permease PerM